MHAKYKLYADVMVALHLLWFAVCIISLPLVLLVDNSRIFVIIFVGLSVLFMAIYRGCPLRIWEKKLRAKHDPKTVYDGVFMQHYLKKYFNVDISRLAVRIIITSHLAILFVLTLI